LAVTKTADTDKADQAAATSVAFTSFAVSGTNPAIMVAVALNGQTVSSVVLSAGLTGGTPYLVKAVVDNTCHVEVWAIPAPTGTGTITVNYSGSSASQLNACLFAGADQTTPAITTDGASLTGTLDTSLTVTPGNLTANDMAYYVGGNANGGDLPAASTGTQVMQGNSGAVNAAMGFRASTGSVTVTWGSGAGDMAIVGVRVQQATGGASTTPRRRALTGVGA
jgi:hypothetical protein